MRTLPTGKRRRNRPPVPLPLLDLIEKARVRSLPRAARQLASRFGLPAATALEVAAAAGLDVGADR